MRLVDLSLYSSIVADDCNPDPAIILCMLHCVFRDLRMIRDMTFSIFSGLWSSAAAASLVQHVEASNLGASPLYKTL
jgi:hypothetical protein